MEYISLYKLFPDRYENIYMDKINNDCSIKFRFQIHDYPTFYISNKEMMCLINQIQQYNKKIITMIHGNIPEIAYTWFLDQTLIDKIKMTNEIEGIISTRRKIQAILDNGHKSKEKDFMV